MEHTPKTTTLGELTRNATLSCIDGRHADCIIGAPGGNMGEFLLLLTALESLGRSFDRDEVRALLDHYLREFGRFYMHTDAHALHAIAHALGRDALSAEAIVNAPPEDHEPLLARLTEPEGIGCGHIKLMLSNPAEYQVRPELIRDAIRAFFLELWDPETRDGLDFVVLFGDHTEDEVIIYTMDDHHHLQEDTVIPLACDKSGKQFVLHDAARRFLLQRSEDFFSRVRGLSDEEDSVFRARVDELADIQLEATRKALFPELPQRVINIVA